jgi:hypothetical protein
MEEYLVKGPPVAKDEINCASCIAIFEVVKAFMIVQYVLKLIEGAIVKHFYFQMCEEQPLDLRLIQIRGDALFYFNKKFNFCE